MYIYVYVYTTYILYLYVRKLQKKSSRNIVEIFF